MGDIINKRDLFPEEDSEVISKDELFPNAPRGSESPAEAPSTLQAPDPADTSEMAPPGGSQEVISKRELFPTEYTPVEAPVQPEMVEDETNTLKDEEIYTNTEMMAPVRADLVRALGKQWADPEKRSDEEVWDTYKSRQRAILSGEVTLMREYNAIRKMTDEEKATANAALDVYAKAAPFWKQGLAEGAEAVGEYVYNAVAPWESPSVLVGLGVGSALTKGAATAGKGVALSSLRAAYKTGGKEAMKKLVAATAKREAKKTALKAGGIAAVNDGAIAVAGDLAYQHGIEIPLGRKDDIDWGEVALAGAIGSVPSGALTTGAFLRKGKGAGIKPKDVDEAVKAWYKTSNNRALPAITQSFNTIKGKVDDATWENMSNQGKLVLGNTDSDDLIMKVFMDVEDPDSIVRIMADNGVRLDWEKGKGEFTKSVVDYIEKLKPADKAPIAKAWEDATGLPLEDGLNRLAETSRRAGQTGYSQSQASKLLESTAGFNTTIRASLAAGKKPKVEDIPPQTMDYIMNNWKQLLVSSLPTTAVNVAGWSLASVTRAATDVIEDGINLRNPYTTSIKPRLKVMSDPLGTKDLFSSNMPKFAPKDVQGQMKVHFGGVGEKASSERFNLPQNAVTKTIDSGVNWAGRLSGVQLQDDWTRAFSGSIELERQLQIKFGKSFSEMVEAGKLQELADADVWDKVAKTSLEDTFSFDFGKGTDGIAHIAKGMGWLSQNSVTGFAFPFGKFMANSLAFSLRHSPAGFLRIAGGYAGVSKKVPLDEVLSEAVVGTTFLMGVGAYSYEKMGEGFAWNEIENPVTGNVVNRENLAPASPYLVWGRMFKMMAEGEQVSKEMKESAWKQLVLGEFGGLEQAEGFKALNKFMEYWSSAEGSESETLKQEFQTIAAGMMAGIASGFTRPLDTYNDWIGAYGPTSASIADIDRRAVNSPAQKGFLELTRYVDNFLEPFIGQYEDGQGKKSLGPTKKSITREGEDVSDPNPLATSTGSKGLLPMNYSNLILGAANLPEWKAGARTAIPQFDRFVNEKLGPAVERRAESLWKNPNFQSMPPARKADLWRKMVTEERTLLLDQIERGLWDGDESQPRVLNERAKWAKVPEVDKRDALKANEIPEGMTAYEYPLGTLMQLNDYIKRYNDSYISTIK